MCFLFEVWNPHVFLLKSSQVQNVVPLCGRFEAQVRIRLTLHAHGPMLHPREEGECALDAVGGHLPRSSQNQRRKFPAKDTGRKFPSSSTAGTFLRIEKNWWKLELLHSGCWNRPGKPEKNLERMKALNPGSLEGRNPVNLRSQWPSYQEKGPAKQGCSQHPR